MPEEGEPADLLTRSAADLIDFYRSRRASRRTAQLR
jgi:hypothetical protein